MFIFFLLFSFSTILEAAEPRTPFFNSTVSARKSGKNVILSGKNCEDLKNEAKAIAKWSKKRLPTSLNCSCGIICSLDVTEFVPPFVKESQGACPIESGPNCWNASLVSAGITGTLRYTSEAEISFWMSSPLCRELNINDVKQPGDIVTIRKNRDEVHSFIHLSDNLSFSKNGKSKRVCYSLQSPDFVYRHYDTPDNCRRVENTSASRHCPFYGNIYRCESMESYLKKNPIRSSETKKALEEITEIECQFEFLMKDRKALDSFIQIMNLTKASLKAVKTLAAQNSKSSRFSANDQFLWKGIQIKADSLIQQIEDPTLLNNGKI